VVRSIQSSKKHVSIHYVDEKMQSGARRGGWAWSDQNEERTTDHVVHEKEGEILLLIVHGTPIPGRARTPTALPHRLDYGEIYDTARG
jgi:hypothetical protein